MNKQEDIFKALEKLELQAKKRKLIEKLNGLLDLLAKESQSGSPNPLININDKLNSEDYLLSLFLDSLGRSWKEDFIKLIPQEENIKEDDQIEDVTQKISELDEKINLITRNFYNENPDSIGKLNTLKHHISELNKSLQKWLISFMGGRHTILNSVIKVCHKCTPHPPRSFACASTSPTRGEVKVHVCIYDLSPLPGYT